MKQKGLRKLVSMILAVVMCLGLTCTGFAADGSYGITITSAADGETYSAYKVFDLTYSDSGDDMIVSYTIDSSSNFYSVVSRATNIFTLTQVNNTSTYVVELATITETNGDGNDTTRTATAEEILAVLSKANLTDVDADGKAVASEDTAKINLNEAGYYYVTTSLGSVVMLDSTTPDVEITDKNGEPTVDKEVKEGDNYGATSDAEVGSTVTFQTTIKDIAGATNLVLHDTMTNLDFVGISSVYYYSNSSDTNGTKLTENTDYTVISTFDTGSSDYDGCTFEIDFSDDFETGTLGQLKSTDDTYKTAYIVVTYTAKLNSSAAADADEDECADGGKNETNVSYGDESKSTSETDTTNTYTYSFEVYKYTGDIENKSNTPLAGAKFVLSKVVDETTYYAVVNENNVLTDWTTYLTEKEDDPEGTAYASVLETGDSGKVSIDGLDADTYYLIETEAPAGYNPLTSPIKILITGTTDDSNELTGEYTITLDDNEEENDGTVINVLNNAGSELPSTGGIGTTIFYIVGGVLVLGAAVLFVTRKRLSSEN